MQPDKQYQPSTLSRRALFAALIAIALTPAEAARKGCGSRGGAGYRLANGKCASKKK